ncbi:acyl-CoA dehydrogenase [Sphingobium sp. OAS761]|uniref:acyl-CoA dehydrogenase family protein n=1 Tax=Sphingobium sp. OAS761 TaxID=2817901 RepID=UPI0020A16AE1|nr:acyl-CoA dehydrogenase family protein [Sphingobium sp. OAS761]MCP1472334.1 acyl-CoA dehydrogenase [Sphingobium sp. OAS761]
MDFRLTAAELAFESEVNDFIAQNLPAELADAQRMTSGVYPEPHVSRAWQAILDRRGWGAPSWPVAFGGPGWSPIQRYLFERSCASAYAPFQHTVSLRLIAPVLMEYGSPSQQEQYLPRIRSGEDYWCQGFSEPSAGSDLRAVKSHLRLDGDRYILNGTKIWTTHGHLANLMFALVRSEHDQQDGKKFSFVILDMQARGVTVQPIATIGVDHELNQVFFDDVVIPAENIIGVSGEGWAQALFLLKNERAGSFYSTRLRAWFKQLSLMARSFEERISSEEASYARTRLSMIELDLDALESLEIQSVLPLAPGEVMSQFASSLIKLRTAKARQAISSLAVDLIGDSARKWETQRPLPETGDGPARDMMRLAVPRYLNDRSQSIFAGTAEIQHDIMARTVFQEQH